MAGTNKQNTNQLFGKISAYKTIVQQNLGKYMNKLSPFAKEYESTLDLVLDILRTLGYSEERLIAELLEVVTGDANIGAAIETGYHGALNSLESKLALIETKQNNNSFIYKLEDAVKVTISSILTSFLSCSISPFIPYASLDKVYKSKATESGLPKPKPINIPTHILDFSNTLHVSPVSESGIYFYNTGTVTKFYKRSGPTIENSTVRVADIKEKNAEKYNTYNYESVNLEDLSDEEKKKAKKVVSVPSNVRVKQGAKQPDEYIYTVRSELTTEGLYKTDDMNAFIWYVANRGDNYDENANNNTSQGIGSNDAITDTIYEYNKLVWDSRRLNARDEETRRSTAEDWDNWLKSRVDYDKNIYLFKEIKNDASEDYTNQSEDYIGHEDNDNQDILVENLFPILQMEPSESWGDLEHLVITFPAQTYLGKKSTKTIYKFNADYLKSIKIFNWKTIIMNLLYELNGISPIPDIQFNLSLSDEIIDAKLSTLILDTITAVDKEVDDSYYTFSNEDYSEALKRMELTKYSAKPYQTAASSAIQNPSGTSVDTMNSLATAATLNEVKSTITRGVYAVAGSSGSTGITKTTLSANLAFESNFLYNLLFAIVRPFVRALLSPQVMLLFCINLDVMGLIDLNNLGSADMDLVSDFIFRKISAIIKKLIIQIKDAIVLYLLEVVKKEIKKLIDEIVILILLEQLNDYIRLLTQIIECLRKFGIGKTVGGIDEVNYADIIPEAKAPET